MAFEFNFNNFGDNVKMIIDDDNQAQLQKSQIANPKLVILKILNMSTKCLQIGEIKSTIEKEN
jgi:hypothetical protein